MADPTLLPGGSGQTHSHSLPHRTPLTGVRNYNERLVLTLIHRHGALASADIARLSGLSAQTVSVIIRILLADELILRGTPQKGRVGKPSVPLTLNPAGVLSFGLKIGRRTMDLVLTDLAGGRRDHIKAAYPYPTPDRLLTFLRRGMETLSMPLAPAMRSRIAGLGIAAPFELWNWLDTVGAPESDMSAWKDFRFAEAISTFSPLEVIVGNDATLACTAEHIFGTGRTSRDFAYFSIGSFVGGGVVLNGAVHAGPTGNAGAFGSIPVGNITQPNHQLLHHGSLFMLERALEAAGHDPVSLLREDAPWEGFERLLDAWIEDAALHLAIAGVAVCSVFDFDFIVVDGGFPPHIRERLVRQINESFARVDTRGIKPPLAVQGSIGRMAGALGAACQPIFSRYLLGQPSFAEA